MRWGVCIIFVSLLAGCCCNGKSKPATTKHALLPEPEEVYEPAVSTALVFDPPVAAGEPRLDLDRSARTPVAVIGYDELETTYFYLRVDDRQSFQPFLGAGNGGNFGWFQRRAVSETVGVRYR